MMSDQISEVSLTDLATRLTAAWLSNADSRTLVAEAPVFLNSIHATLSELLQGPPELPDVEIPSTYVPAVSVRKSLASKDHIISLIDGKPYKALRRHLARHGLSPDEYRRRYNLKPDYPIVAENYSESRRAMAKELGLGRKPGQKVTTKRPVLKVKV